MWEGREMNKEDNSTICHRLERLEVGLVLEKGLGYRHAQIWVLL